MREKFKALLIPRIFLNMLSLSRHAAHELLSAFKRKICLETAVLLGQRPQPRLSVPRGKREPPLSEDQWD